MDDAPKEAGTDIRDEFLTHDSEFQADLIAGGTGSRDERGGIPVDDGPKEIVSGLCVAEHDGGLAIFQPDTGYLFVCNRVGALIWSGLSKGLSIDEISKEIAQRFSVWPEQAQHDACVFVTQLESRGWLVRRPAKS